MARQAVRLLTVRLPNWTVWYGWHTGHFWALLKRRPGGLVLHVEARSAVELESRVLEAERWLPEPAVDRHERRLPKGVAPIEGVLVARAPERPPVTAGRPGRRRPRRPTKAAS
ncbi:hypothetical protein [Planobispora takensis]